VALAAIGLGRNDPSAAEAEPASSAKASAAPKRAAEPAPLPPRRLVFVSAATVGFVFLLMELVWYRMLAPLLGGSTYPFGLILAVALLGIGLGAFAYVRRGRRPATLGAFAMTCALEAVCLAAPFAAGDSIPLLAILTRPLGGLRFPGCVLSWSLITAIVVLPAAAVSGYQFPLLVALLGRGRPDIAQDVGYAYAWNTGGTILGSLAGGFRLLPLPTPPGAWRLSVVLLAVLGAVIALLSAGESKRRWRPLAAGGMIAASLVLVFSRGPTAAWRHSPIGAGRLELTGATPNRVREWQRSQRRQLRWEA